jgi:LPS export ABC transporter permease LptG
VYILALAVLLSALVTIGLLTKNSELIVMRACGVSLYRTAVPLMAFALAVSAFLFAMEERVLGIANRRADRLNHLIRGGSPQTFDVMTRKWIVGASGDIYHYQYFDPRKNELNALSVLSFDSQSRRLTRRVFAQRATYLPPTAESNDDGQWRVVDGWVRSFGPGQTVKTFEGYANSLMRLEPAGHFVTEEPEPRRMTYAQLQRYIAELQQSGYDVLEHQVELHRKTAFPLVPIVMTLIAVPFAVTTGRRGALYGIGVGIVLALVYWTMISVFAAFGTGGLISPVLAAWAPNLLFGAAAAYLLLTVRT